MAIQNRRGAYVDLNPAKAVPGELLVVQSGDPNATDGKAVYITFASGDIKMLATKSDVETLVADATDEIAQSLENTVDGYADRAETAATNAEGLVNGAEAAIVAKGVEVVNSIPSDYTALTAEVSDLKSAFDDFEYKQLLLADEVPDTTQEYTFSNENVTQIVHSANGDAVRADVFTYGSNTITETRTLASGASLVIATNLQTLETTVTYSEGE